MRPDDLRGRAIFLDSLDSLGDCNMFYILAFSGYGNPPQV
jgi:hypothetical protein